MLWMLELWHLWFEDGDVPIAHYGHRPIVTR